MRYEFRKKNLKVAWAQWEGPGQVALGTTDPADREFFREYFSSDVTYLAAHFDGEEDAFQTRRRDWTPWEFERACRGLSRHGFGVRKTATAPADERPAATG
jgi:hypothetical protein